jgi:uncharacterized protein (TIGR02147 family)
MPDAKSRLSVFSYLDYRAFLTDYCKQARQENRRFSNRHFAMRAGLPVSNASLLSKVRAGKRKLTLDLRFKFAKALELTGEEFRYFDLLVQFNQAERMEAKNHFYAELAKYRGSRAKILKSDEYRYYSKWHYSVLRALFGYDQKEKNPQALAKRLFPAVTPQEVEEAIRVLLDLKLVKRLANGYAVAENHVATQREIRDLAARNRLYEMMRLALDALDQVRAEFREYNSLTVFVSEKGFRSIKERIQSFREELRELVEQDKGEDRVYTLAMQLFPNVRIAGMEEGGAPAKDGGKA